MFCKKIQNTKYLIQLLDVFVLNVGFANLTILRYVDRGIPLKGPSIFLPSEAKDLKNGNTSHPPPHAACSALVDESDTAAGFSLHGT